MSEASSVYRRTFNYLKEAKTTVAATLSIMAVNAYFGDSLIIHSDEPFGTQMEKALPSIAATPDVTGVQPLDQTLVTGAAAIGLELSHRTTPLREMIPIALGAHVISCSADALVDQTDLVAHAADAGSSGIWSALVTKTLLDRILSAKDETSRRRWKMGTLAFGGVMAFGGYVFAGSADGTLDLIAHASAMSVGVAGYRFGEWRRQHRQEPAFANVTQIGVAALDLAA